MITCTYPKLCKHHGVARHDAKAEFCCFGDEAMLITDDFVCPLKRNIKRLRQVKQKEGSKVGDSRLNLTLPIKPLSINRAFQGRRFKTKKCKRFEKQLADLLPADKRVGGYISIDYRFYLVNWALTDIDNLVKVLQDILVKRGIIDDDRKVVKESRVKIKAKVDCIEIAIRQEEV